MRIAPGWPVSAPDRRANASCRPPARARWGLSEPYRGAATAVAAPHLMTNVKMYDDAAIRLELLHALAKLTTGGVDIRTARVPNGCLDAN